MAARARTSMEAASRGRGRLIRLLGGIFLLSCVTIGFEVLLLPSGLFGADAAPVPVPTDSEPQHWSAAHGGGDLRFLQPLRSATAGPPNISIVMPCFGQSAFLEEGLTSVIAQDYPAAEILVVDDGSTDKCGDVAHELLKGKLAAPRRQSIRKLQAWWGWGADELRRFSDEVLLTPNRGVAHARNTGIRRARGDWIVCLDADDTIAPSYFFEAMAHVAAYPSTNIIYANQQFFGESKWQWNVPDLMRVDMALVNGPLPLMTLFRRSLWRATPHGFDEALPKGHEDWAFWLQLTRLSLRPHKLDKFLTFYRFKKNSKMRNREKQNPEVPRLLRTLFADLYPVRKLLTDHHELLRPNGFSEAVRMDVSVSVHLFDERSAPHMWRGMILQAKSDLDAAVSAYRAAKQRAAPYDWQPSFRLWRLLSDIGDMEAAEAEKMHLLRIWGPAQFAWYSTDTSGNVLEFSSASPSGGAG
jgi:glycosyltransferase involved in cell wall biosynthesis